MVKKLTVFGVVVIMLLGIWGLAACSNTGQDLAEYKAAGKAAIDTHVATKTQSDYSAENWALVCKTAEDGKTAVEAAQDKPAVDAAVTTVKTAIDAVEKEDLMGAFYTLQEAFNEGFLTKDDIMHISHFATGRVVEVIDATDGTWESEIWKSENNWTKIKIVDFTPQQAKPSLENLSEQIIADMKVAFYEANQVLIDGSLQSAISSGTLNAGTTALETIVVQEFLGTYNGFYAMRITSTLWGYGGATISQLVSDIGWNLPSAPAITVFTI